MWNLQKSRPATEQECVSGETTSTQSSFCEKVKSFIAVQCFFLSSATFSYHPLVPYQPDLLPVFIHWPMYHKLKLSCSLPRVEIVGNPNVWELLNYFDSSLFFSITPLSTGNWCCVCVCLNEQVCVTRLSSKLTWKIFHNLWSSETPGCSVRYHCNSMCP